MVPANRATTIPVSSPGELQGLFCLLFFCLFIRSIFIKLSHLIVLFQVFVYVYWVFSYSFMCVMAIICLCVPLYVLIGAGHQGIHLLIVSVCESRPTGAALFLTMSIPLNNLGNAPSQSSNHYKLVS